MSVPFGRAAVPLFAYQRKWIRDRRRFKVGMFARQTGKTFTTTLEIVDRGFEAHVMRSRPEPWVILSRGERQAKEAMDEGVKKHARAYNLGFEEWAGEWKADNGTTYNALEVTFPNGAKVTALPANPDTARGFSRNVFLDEFAIHQNSKEIWGALFPIISAGWDIRVTSTPKGRKGKFYEIISGRDETWSRHIVDIYQAVRDGLPRDIEELRAGLADEDLWAQEYELQFLDDASAWLSYDLIGSCEAEEAGDPGGYQGGICYVGMDIGRKKDLTVIWVLEEIGDVLWTREIVELKGAKFSEQDAALDEIMKRYRVGRLCMDETGMGLKPVEDAQRRYGALTVEGVTFTAGSKLLMATKGKQAFEDRAIRIPEGNPKLRADLHKLKKVASELGTPRFVADRDEDHADRTWALFLGIHASGRNVVPAGTTIAANLGHNGGPPLDDETRADIAAGLRPPIIMPPASDRRIIAGRRLSLFRG